MESLLDMEFIWVPGGCFEMGCRYSDVDCDKNNQPRHQVCVDALWVGKYEVTNEQFMKFASIWPNDRVAAISANF